MLLKRNSNNHKWSSGSWVNYHVEESPGGGKKFLRHYLGLPPLTTHKWRCQREHRPAEYPEFHPAEKCFCTCERRHPRALTLKHTQASVAQSTGWHAEQITFGVTHGTWTQASSRNTQARPTHTSHVRNQTGSVCSPPITVTWGASVALSAVVRS